jgi:predicted enzyme related to lactoylglutathione lyase
MEDSIRPGAVIFAADFRRLAKFYEAVTEMTIQHSDDSVVVLASKSMELVLHALRGESDVTEPPVAREDTYIKPFFPVKDLAAARAKAAQLGGRLKPASEEWEWRGFRACDGVDPEGNVVQFRTQPAVARTGTV